jgi:hypothetical protein
VNDKYDYRNCQSLFGYALETHIRCRCTCQICGCGGGDRVDVDLWRQMTVEHLIGQSQGGYQILDAVVERFPNWPDEQRKRLAHEINAANMVTACSFCNSTTSRHRSSKDIHQLLQEAEGTPDQVFACIKAELEMVLEAKRADVARKIAAVRSGFDTEFRPKLDRTADRQ